MSIILRSAPMSFLILLDIHIGGGQASPVSRQVIALHLGGSHMLVC